MKNMGYLIVLCLTSFFIACAIVCTPIYLYTQKTTLANAEEHKDAMQVGARLTPDTGEKTAYTTTLTVKTEILDTGAETGRFKFMGNIVYDTNVSSVEIVDVVVGNGATVPENLTIVKVDGEKAYYGFQASCDTWASAERNVWVKLKIISTGAIELCDDTGKNFKISQVVTDIPEPNEPIEQPEDKTDEKTDDKTDEKTEEQKKEEVLNEIVGKVDGLIAKQNSDGLDRVWEVVRPFFVYVLSALLSGVIVAKIISTAIKKKYDTKAIASEVLKNLTEKDISVDIAALTKKEIADIGMALKTGLQEGMTDLSIMKKSVALLCNALSKSKTLTDGERKELAEQAAKLDKEAQVEVKEKVVVRLEKVDVAEQPSDDGLFGYLEK